MKFFGQVGFMVDEVEIDQDVWGPKIIERSYYGDVYRNTRRIQSTSSQNGQFVVSNQISILSDLYAQQNWALIRYVIWNGQKLEVTNVDINYPRLTLDIGGIYNAENSIRVEQSTSESSRF